MKKKAYSLFLILTLNCLVSCKEKPISPSFFYSTDQIVEQRPDFGTFVNEMEYLATIFEEIDSKILPDIIYALLTVSIEEESFQIQVEIIEDQKNGKRYHIQNDYIDIWVQQDQLQILYQEDNFPLEPLPDEYIEQFECINNQNEFDLTKLYEVYLMQELNIEKRKLNVLKC